MSTPSVLKFFADNPRSTAAEADITNAEANALVGQGKLMIAGKRVTGKRGRPPYEFVVAGYDLSNDPAAQEAVNKAKAKVEAHRRFERLSNLVMHAANEFGHGSPQHIDAKLSRYEAFEFGLPELPSKNDYVLAGVIREDDNADLGLLPGEDTGEEE